MVRGARFAVALALAGCLQAQPSGPALGDCAIPPSGSWTFGEAGIGTCLAGPTDIRFVDLDGRMKLLVSNGDPYNNFASGSLLVIDWEGLDLSAGPRIPMDQVPAAATTLGGSRYLGQIGLVLDREDGTPLALVPARFSRGAITTDVDDLVHVVDLTDAAAPVPWSGGGTVTVGSDPMHVVVAGEQAYVTHLNERYMAVLDTHATPIEPAVLSGSARLVEGDFDDVDGSGSNASLSATLVNDASILLNETWTLTWSDATWRMWVLDDGLLRWDLGTGDVVVDPSGPSIPASTFSTPITSTWAGLDGNTGAPALWIANGGNLFIAVNTSGTTWALDATTAAVRGGTPSTPESLDGPASFSFDEVARVVFDAGVDGEPRSIGVGTQGADGIWSVSDVAVLVPPSGQSFEDPHVQVDPFLRSPRMWMSVRDGADSFSIGVSASPDGDVWSDPVFATGLPADTASPVISWYNGRYVGWFSVWQDDAWWLARAESVDGLDWHDLELVEALPGGSSKAAPPRTAILTQVRGGFEVEGTDSGRLDGLARDGSVYTQALTGRGFAFEVTTGAVAEGEDIDEDLGANGVIPGTSFEADGETLMSVTLLGSDGRRRLGLVALDGGEIFTDSVDLLDLDAEGLTEAHDPVVFGQDGAFTLLFAEPTETGTVIRRATSSDARSWTLADEPALRPSVEFTSEGVVPGSVQTLSDGRLRLWFTATQRTTRRIGSAISEDGGATWSLEPGATTAWQVGPGVAGDFDDAGVRDPRYFEHDGVSYLAYAGDDGDALRLGLLELTGEPDAAGPYVRYRDGRGELNAWLPRIWLTFASGGHHHPVVVPDGDGIRVWFAGETVGAGRRPRLGTAVGLPEQLFAEVRHPTSGDVLQFRAIGAGGESGEILLAQALDTITTSTSGLSGLSHDAERGMLYVTSDAVNSFTVVDVERKIGELDGNVDDIEAVVRVRSDNGSAGMRDVLALPGTDLLYVTGRNPDGVLVLDGSQIVDDTRKQLHEDVLLDILPLRRSNDDAGVPGEARLSGMVMGLRDMGGRRHLFVPHFRDNSLYVFDLDRGEYGEEVGYVPFIGENPHIARVSPDGRYVVVANFLGEVDDGHVSSTLTVLDADPDSPTFLEVVATLVNR